MQKEVYEFISQQTNDPIVEWRTCAVSGEEFPIYQGDVDMWEKISPVIGGKKYLFPLPRESWQARLAHKLSVRNNRCLYRSVCDLTGDPIISLYDPEKGTKVYSHKSWHSDDRDVFSYGKEPDMKKSILGQLKELSDDVPKVATFITSACENCTYATGAIDSKNCYLTDTCSYTENAWYSSFVLYCENVIDCYKCDHLINGYVSVRCQNSTNIQYCIDVSDSTACYYSISLRNCSNCFGCNNLVNKSYYFFNKAYTKEEYSKKLAEYDLGSYQVREMLREKFQTHIIPQTVLRSTGNTNIEHCVGDGLNNCKDIFFGFELLETQDARYTTDGPPKNNTIIDTSYLVNADRVYNSFSVVGTGIYCSMFAWNCSNVFYSYLCQNCHNIFCCVGLQNKTYCIFNKQYEKETYHKKIKELTEIMVEQGEWGMFPHMNDFSYNETVAKEFFPLDASASISRGYTRQDKVVAVNVPENARIIKIEELPDNINDVGEDIVQCILICPETGKPYRVIHSELAFYKNNHIPLPRVHQDVRYSTNKQYIPARNFYIRTCDDTGKQELSVFHEDVPFKVYSQKAYDAFMYG